MIRFKTGWYFALDRPFHPQNGHCKSLPRFCSLGMIRKAFKKTCF